MKLLVLLTPLVVLGLVMVLQRVETWMDRTARPSRRWRAEPVPVRRPTAAPRAARVSGRRG